MFGKNFELNDNTIPIVEEIGRHMPGGFLIYKAHGSEELLYANHTVFDIFGCDGLEDFKSLTGYTFRGLVHPDDYESVSKTIWEQISHDDMDRLPVILRHLSDLFKTMGKSNAVVQAGQQVLAIHLRNLL